MKLLKRMSASRTFKLCIVIILQILSVFFIVGSLVSKETVLFNVVKIPGSMIYNIVLIIDICLAASVFAKNDLNPVYKMTWIIILAAVPVIGTLIYLLWGDRKIARRKALEISNADEKSKCALFEFEQHVDTSVLSGGEKASARYLQKFAGAPVFKNTYAEYFPWGEVFFEALLKELEKAEKFIFIEYFIVKNGYMWDKVYEILVKKARAGVDVRFVYDALGSLFDVSEDFWVEMRKSGIKCYKFNPIRFSWKLTDYTFLNHRDHRKICVIDGNTGFTGGINISDEYINRVERFGKWKDTAVMLKGDAVYSLTTTFLKMWEYVSREEVDDYRKYAPNFKYDADCYVQPYDDSPLDFENVSENSYFNVIYHARKYVYITTPYLVIDNEMITALSLAAKSGVDVKIITPGIPDKKYVYYLTQSYYAELIRAGVKIYEYSPGFMHAKMFIRDDEQAIVGSANMDYRSLYLHFENCCSFYGGQVVKDVKEDFDIILSESRRITEDDLAAVPRKKKLLQLLLKFFAPVM